MQLSRDNHYVPQFYLRQWSNDGNTIHCYDTVARNAMQPLWRNAHIKSACCWKDFYTLDYSGSLDDSIEHLFSSEYEANASAAIRRVSEGFKPNDEELDCLIDYAFLQMIRTPAWYMKMHKTLSEEGPRIIHETMIRVLEEYANNADAGPSKPLVKDADQQDFPPFPKLSISFELNPNTSEITATLPINRDNYLAHLGRVLSGDLRRVFHDQKWIIYRKSDEGSFPTSDNPLVRLGLLQGGTISLDVSPDVPGVFLFMSITPDALLICEIGTDADNLRGILEVPGMIELLKNAIVNSAVMYVFSDTEDDSIPAVRSREINQSFIDYYLYLLNNWNDLQSDDAMPTSYSSYSDSTL